MNQSLQHHAPSRDNAGAPAVRYLLLATVVTTISDAHNRRASGAGAGAVVAVMRTLLHDAERISLLTHPDTGNSQMHKKKMVCPHKPTPTLRMQDKHTSLTMLPPPRNRERYTLHCPAIRVDPWGTAQFCGLLVPDSLSVLYCMRDVRGHVKAH